MILTREESFKGLDSIDLAAPCGLGTHIKGVTTVLVCCRVAWSAAFLYRQAIAYANMRFRRGSRFRGPRLGSRIIVRTAGGICDGSHAKDGEKIAW